MVATEGKSFIGVTVELDGRAFIRCEFTDCVFVFRGIARWTMSDCRTDPGCRFSVEEHALTTINAIRDLVAVGSGPWAGFGAQVARWLLEPGEAKAPPN